VKNNLSYHSSISFRLIVILLSFSILITGCHSYFTIQKKDYSNIGKMDDIKVVYKNGKEFVVERDDTTNIKLVGDSLVISEGVETKIIGMNEVEKIKENKFDLGGTITISLVALTILVVLFLSMNPFKT
jgi:hypothetical protein